MAADAVALGIAAAVSPHVHATTHGIVIASLVLEAPSFVFSEAFSFFGSRMKAATSEDSEGGYAVLSLASMAVGTLWVVVGLAFADRATTRFDIAGFWPYVGTLALLFAANFAVYLPLRLGRAIAQRS